jgi:hypothetical protein
MSTHCLAPLKKSKRSKATFNYAVYDIETEGIGSLNFVMIGFYDGERYTCFRDLGKFFAHVRQPKYHEWRIFAHFGGRFDVHFLFDYLREHLESAPFEFYCSGSAVISFTLRSGREWIRFADSYRLMPKSLMTLTHEFNVEHKKLPFAPLDEKYNRHDCMGLYEVLTAFFDAFDVTSETIASHAMRVFRTSYLKDPIPGVSMEIENFIRPAYYGGRCEIYRFDAAEVNKYDVNSLYPYAMTGPLPYAYRCWSTRLPDDDAEIGFYEATVDYPDHYVPCLPCRLDKLYFPVGRWRGNFSSIDLRQAISDGAAVKIHRGVLFTAAPIMRDYVAGLHRMKQEAEESGQPARRYIAKICMNSLYGKTAQRRDQRSYCLDPGTDRLYSNPDHPKIFPVAGSNGIAYYETFSHSRHILPHIAATVTSRARMVQLRYLRQPKRIWYTDTDSLFTTGTVASGTELGEMKYEGCGSFQAWALKEYTFNGEISMKGVPMSILNEETGEKERDEKLANAYNDGWELKMSRMAGFMESIRGGHKTVRMVETRRVRRNPGGKRARCGHDTRPWNIDELS